MDDPINIQIGFNWLCFVLSLISTGLLIAGIVWIYFNPPKHRNDEKDPWHD